MTLPDERYRAVLYTRRFLLDLLDSKKNPRIPKHLREEARNLLRHYPSEYDMKRTSEQAPDVFAERMEDVHRLFKSYEIKKNEQA